MQFLIMMEISFLRLFSNSSNLSQIPRSQGNTLLAFLVLVLAVLWLYPGFNCVCSLCPTLPFHLLYLKVGLWFSSTKDTCIAWNMFITRLYSLQRKFREGHFLLAVEDGRSTLLSLLVKIFQRLEITYKNMMRLPAVLSWCHYRLAITALQ